MTGAVLQGGIWGVVAGAAGTIALDITTYGDMLLRGRSASNVPATLAGRLADVAGIEAMASRRTDQYAASRRQAAGALLGYSTGLAIGGLYGVMESNRPGSRGALAGVAVGLFAMAASDIPIAVSGVSDPRTWSPTDWASDLIPHLIYGLVVVTTFEAIRQSRTD
jgi:hypothetical protein